MSITTTLDHEDGWWTCRVVLRAGRVVVTVRDEAGKTRHEATEAAGVRDDEDWREDARREALGMLLDAVAEVAR